jgi:YVTN family beta-propeller protein
VAGSNPVVRSKTVRSLGVFTPLFRALGFVPGCAHTVPVPERVTGPKGGSRLSDQDGAGEGEYGSTEIRTFLIADVRGYTLFTQERGDEAAAKLAKKFAGLAREGVEARGGSVIELRGDEALAVFASPRQAIRAAVDLQQRFVDETLDDPSLPLMVGIGLDAGEAVPVEGGYRGGALNTAARLCGQAGPGEVLATPEVVHLARAVEGVRYLDRGTVHLKGIAEPVRLIRVVSEERDTRAALAPLAAERAKAAPPGGRGPRRKFVALGTAVAVVAAAVVVPIVLLGHGQGPSLTGISANSVGLIDLKSHRLVDRVAVGSRPLAIASGEGAVWVADSGDDTVARIDPHTHDVQTIRVGQQPAGIAVGFGSVWVANSGERTVSRISPKTNQVVQTIDVGNGPIGVAVGQGAVWVTESTDATVAQIDPSTGKLKRRIGVGADPVAVAVGAAIWVSNAGDGTVSEVDPGTGEVVRPIPVGSGPRGLAVTPRAVWVANDLDGTVSRIDPATGHIAETIPVGDGPAGVAMAGGTVWVPNEFDGTISRIESGATRPSALHVGSTPQAAVAVGSSLWFTAAGAGPGHHGGTLTFESVSNPDSIDPGVAYSIEAWQFLTVTNDGLLTYQRVGGPNGSTLVPDLATSIPTPTEGGATYTFQLRPDIRYSTGVPVRASDVRRAIERLFRIGGSGPGFYKGLVGAAACSKTACDLSKGIVTDDATGTVSFHLTSPDPEFLHKLSLPFSSVVPSGAPVHKVLTDPLPSTGPYMIQTYVPSRHGKEGRLVLVRNPGFKEWSPAAQPEGNPDRIVWRLGTKTGRAVTDVERGNADWMSDFPGSRFNEIQTRFADQVHVYALPWVIGIALNSRTRPFDQVDVRRAVNYAVDRAKAANLAASGFGTRGRVTCQILPPNFEGYRPYCPYTVAPNAEGTWTAPDLATAARLLRRAHVAHGDVTVWTTSDPGCPVFLPLGRYFVSSLDRLGFRARLKTIPHCGAFFNTVADVRQGAQAFVVGWAPDYPSASNFLQLLFSCASLSTNPNQNLNYSEFCDPAVDRLIRRALQLQVTDPHAAGAEWARVDRAVVRAASWAPLFNPTGIDFLSRRMKNYEYNPEFGMLIDQLWVQ